MQSFRQTINRRLSTQPDKHHDPVLSPEDEAYLQRVMAQEGGEPALPPWDLSDQIASPTSPAMKDAENVPLPTSPVPHPTSPVEDFGKELGEEGRRASEKAGSPRGEDPQPVKNGSPRDGSPVKKEKKKRPWSTFFQRKGSEKDKGTAAPDTSGAEGVETSPDKTKDEEARQEAQDIAQVLEQLNLAAVNNKVFSISDDTQELLRKFKLIFVDIMNGVPTAYHDLEMLFTNGNKQLTETFTRLPSPLQKLIEKLPERWTESFAPEILAVAAERAGQSGMSLDNMGKATAAAGKMGLKVPDLKELVGKPAALVGMMRSIVAFLRARFPAVLGVNMLWSLALSILLFVLWYCHKRGKEVRLENERLVTEEEIKKMNEQSDGETVRATETLTTTAPQGASAEEIRSGIQDAKQAREAALAAAEKEQEEKEKEKEKEEERQKQSAASGEEASSSTPAPLPQRSKSRFSIFGRSSTTPISPTTKIEPYPGT